MLEENHTSYVLFTKRRLVRSEDALTNRPAFQRLTARESKILEALVLLGATSAQPVSGSAVRTKTWGNENVVENALYQHVKNIRRKLGGDFIGSNETGYWLARPTRIASSGEEETDAVETAEEEAEVDLEAQSQLSREPNSPPEDPQARPEKHPIFPQVSRGARANPFQLRAWLLVLMLVAVCLLGALAALGLRGNDDGVRTVSFALAPPQNTSIESGIAVSPDGKSIVFSAKELHGSRETRIWLRRLESVEYHPIAGTEGGYYPFWSPDSDRLGFFAKGGLFTVRISGGPVRMVTAMAEGGGGGAWDEDETILFSRFGLGLHRVKADGTGLRGVTSVLPSSTGDLHFWPQFLGGGRFLYFCQSREESRKGVYAASLENAKAAVRVLSATDSQAIFSPSQGLLYYIVKGELMKQEFDVSRLSLRGQASFAARPVEINYSNGRGEFAMDQVSLSAYLSGKSEYEIQLWDRMDGSFRSIEPGGDYLTPRLSPKGDLLALRGRDAQGNYDIRLVESARYSRPPVFSRFTALESSESYPVWSPDGRQIAFRSNKDGQVNLYQKMVFQGDSITRLTNSSRAQFPYDWSADGRYLLYREDHQGTSADLWLLPLNNAMQPIPVRRTRSNESQGQFWPRHAEWLAYVSNDTGRNEVYLGNLREDGLTVQVSRRGAVQPRWRKDGKELFYVRSDGALVAVSVSIGANGPEFQEEKPLFTADLAEGNSSYFYSYDVGGDGQQVWMICHRNRAASRRVVVTIGQATNWASGELAGLRAMK